MPDVRNVSPLEHYKRVCSMLDLFCKRMDDTFRLFIQLSTAVVGGFIWLKMQPNAKDFAYLFPVARLIIPALAIATVVQILSDLRSWYGYRKAEVRLNPRAPAPSAIWSAHLEYLRAIMTVLAGLGAYCWLK
jgi:hypothetical protein